MTLIKCKTHGLSGIVDVCEHLYDRNTDRIITAGILDFDPPDVLFTEFFYCARCVELHSLPASDGTYPYDDHDRFAAHSYTSICQKCFKARTSEREL